MDGDEARKLLAHVRRWAAKGWIPGPSVARIEAELAPALAQEPSGRRAALPTILHGLGGVLLGAAAIALVVLLFDQVAGDHRAEQGSILFALGLGLLAGGVALWFLSRNQDLADALLVAALVCLTFAPLPDEALGQWFSVVSVAVAAAVSFTRRTTMAAFFATLALQAAAFVVSLRLFGQDQFFGPGDAGIMAWLAIAAVHLAALAFLRVGFKQEWVSPALGLAAVLVAAPVAVFTAEVLDLDDHGAPELAVALPAAALLALALRIRDPNLLVGAATVLAIDAIVFAFDVGGLVFGILVILAVAAAVLALATVLRRRWADPGT
ncbi:MAG: hypothetical protein QOD77_152 [Thermoplasmata archaeon]|nr:hypothetical protein [Thermoplasmata archaeon]